MLFYAKRAATASGAREWRSYTRAHKLARTPPHDGAPPHVWVDMRNLQPLTIDVLHAQEDSPATAAYDLLAHLRAGARP
jgi:hypothetical protein